MNEKEYTVTIPLDEYKDLIQAQTYCDDLIDYIFSVMDYDGSDNLEFDEQAAYLLTVYLKAEWSDPYNKKIEKLKSINKKEEE